MITYSNTSKQDLDVHSTSGYTILGLNSGAPWVIKFGKLSIRENLVMTSPSGRPYVRPWTRRVEVSRKEFLPYPLKSFVPYCFKSCQLTKCLVDFRGRPFDFWGGYGWFQKKRPADWFRQEKSMKIDSWEKNILPSCSTPVLTGLRMRA